MEKSAINTGSEGAYSVILAGFLQESIGQIIPWIIVAFVVILCDLVVGIRKSLLMGEEVRFSSACRRTLGKCITYFMVVIMGAVIDVAAHGGGEIEKWTCFIICIIECASILSNILKPKGYDFNLGKLVAVIFGKKFDVKKEDIEEIINHKS